MKDLPTRNYVKQFTNREWKKFSLEIQEKLCQKYTIILIQDKDGKILPAEQTPREFLQQPKKKIAVQILRNLNKTNLDKGITQIHKMTDSISQFADQIDSFGSTKKRGKVKL